MPPYGGLLKPRGSKVRLLKSMFNAENFICRLSLSIPSECRYNSLWNMCCRLKKITKTPYFGVQGRSKSSTLVRLDSSSAVLVMIISKSVSTCKCSHAIWVRNKVMPPHRFAEAVVSLRVAIAHHQFEAMSSCADQPLRLLHVGRVELVQHSGLHVLEHDAVTGQLQLAWILSAITDTIKEKSKVKLGYIIVRSKD